MNNGSDDTTVILAIKRGDGERFKELIYKYKDRVFAVVLARWGDRLFSEEVTHDAFVTAYLQLHTFRGESSFLTWVTRIALNRASRVYGGRKSFENIPIPDGPLTPVEEGERRQLQERFRECFEKLPERLQEVLSLIALGGFSYEEAHGVIGVPVGTIRSRLHQARLQMKVCMKDVL